MARHKIAHATLKGPSVVKELVIGLTLGLAAGGIWKCITGTSRGEQELSMICLRKARLALLLQRNNREIFSSTLQYFDDDDYLKF